jgi:hypothetical protein
MHIGNKICSAVPHMLNPPAPKQWGFIWCLKMPTASPVGLHSSQCPLLRGGVAILGAHYAQAILVYHKQHYAWLIWGTSNMAPIVAFNFVLHPPPLRLAHCPAIPLDSDPVLGPL